MGFLSGLLTGAATSIDNQLKADMKRTEERMDGMEQYRVTRRRAKLEAQEKEKKELRDVLNTLSGYTDGDEDKAIQLFNHAGKTIDGSKDLLKTLKTNRAAGKDINTVIKYAEAGAEPGNFTSFINRNITPITPITSPDGEPMQASGLYSLFKPKLDEKINRNVESAVPLPTTEMEGAARTASATIDYTGLLSAEEAAFEKKKRGLIFKQFDLDVDKFNSLDKKTKADIENASAAQALAEKVATSNMSEDVKASARADAQLANDTARLGIAQQDAVNRALGSIGDRKLAGVELEIKKLEKEKLLNNPEYASYEAMMVAADNELFSMEMLPEDEQDAERMRELTALRAAGLKGMQDTAATDATTKAAYSTTTANNSYDKQLKREMSTIGMYNNLTDTISEMTEGKAADYLTAISRAIDNTSISNVRNDPTMTAILNGATESLNQDVQNVAKKKFAEYNEAKNTTSFDSSLFDVTDFDNMSQAVNQITSNNSDLSKGAALIKYATDSNLPKGHIVEMKGGKYLMWTGSKFIGIKASTPAAS